MTEINGKNEKQKKLRLWVYSGSGLALCIFGLMLSICIHEIFMTLILFTLGITLVFVGVITATQPTSDEQKLENQHSIVLLALDFEDIMKSFRELISLDNIDMVKLSSLIRTMARILEEMDEQCGMDWEFTKQAQMEQLYTWLKKIPPKKSN